MRNVIILILIFICDLGYAPPISPTNKVTEADGTPKVYTHGFVFDNGTVSLLASGDARIDIVAAGAGTFLKLDCSNDPLTGDLEITLPIHRHLCLDGATTQRSSSIEILDMNSAVNTLVDADSYYAVTNTITRNAVDTGDTYGYSATLSSNGCTGGYRAYDFTIDTHDMANGEWTYGFGGTYDTASCTTATSNAAVFYAGTSTVDPQCNDYGVYISSGFDWAGYFNGNITDFLGATNKLLIDGTTTRTSTTECLDIDATIDTTTATNDVPTVTITTTRAATDTGGTYLIKGDLTTGNMANDEWSYCFGGTMNTTASLVQSEAAIFYAGTSTLDDNCRERGIYISSGYDWAAFLGGYTEIEVSAAEAVALYIDGVTNDYTGAADVYVMNLKRDLNVTSTLGITGINDFVDIKNTSATLGISDYWRGIDCEIQHDGNVVHSGAWAGWLWYRAGEFEIDDNGTYDTAINQQMLIEQVCLDVTIGNSATFTDTSTGSPASNLSVHGLKIDIDDKPTLTSGTLARQTNGIYIDVEANAAGSSSARGILIADVSGGDTNWGILDVSGANWSLETDSQKVYLGGAKDSYFEFDGNSMNLVANAVTATDNLIITANGVGIGVDPPLGDLHLQKNQDGAVGFLCWNRNNTASAAALIDLTCGTGAGTGTMQFLTYPNGRSCEFTGFPSLQIWSASAAGESFSIWTFGTYPNPALFIDYDGNVGIGTSTPASKLDVSVPTNGGNAGAKNEIQGLAKVYMQGTGTLTDGTVASKTVIGYIDADPVGEWTGTDADIATSTNGTYYKEETHSLGVAMTAAAIVGDKVLNPLAGGDQAWTDDENFGFWIYSTVTLSAGDMIFRIYDATAAGGFTAINIPVVSADKWTWCNLDIAIAANLKDVITDIAFAVGVDLGACNIYFDFAAKWDNTEETALTKNILTDGVLSVLSLPVAAGSYTAKTEYTNFFVDYGATDNIVTITDEDANCWQILYCHQS